MFTILLSPALPDWQTVASAIVLTAAAVGALIALSKHFKTGITHVKGFHARRRSRRSEDIALREMVPILLAEFKPNGGGSMKDALNRLEAGNADIMKSMCIVAQRQLASHNLDHEGKWETDSEGMCRYVNPAMAQMAGRNVEDFFGLGWKNAIHPEDLEELSLSWASAVKDKRDFSFTFRYLKPNGEEVPVRLTGKRMFSADGRDVIGWFGDIHRIGPGVLMTAHAEDH